MNSRILFVLILCAFPSASHARLGETEGQSQQRYGQPRAELTGPNEKHLMIGALERAYEYDGWRVRAAYVDGVCVRIEYAHMPDGGVPKPIADSEVKAILDAEKGKFSWREDKLTKSPGAAGEVEKALKGVFNLRRWGRSDHAKAEMALGIVLKLETRNADDLAKKVAKKGQEKAAPANGGKAPPKF